MVPVPAFQEFRKADIGSEKYLRGIKFIVELPKTITGKMKRNVRPGKLKKKYIGMK